MGTVPSTVKVCPLIQFLSITVEDIGMELHDAPITRVVGGVAGLCSIDVVDIITVGREGIGHFQMALRNGDTDGGRLQDFVVQHHLYRY